jgi:uncharacterized protein (DUF305 family)
MTLSKKPPTDWIVMNKKLCVALFGAVMIAVLPACGSSSSSGSQDTDVVVDEAAFNDADVMFAQMMIPHHEQAIEMSDIALDPTVGAGERVRELATQIKNAQDPEITLMKELLTAWGKPLTSDEDHSSMMSGMLSADELAELGTLTGAAFDSAWAKAMIAHHEGAIEMAEVVLADGKNAETLALAQAIISTQQAEIDILRAL